MAKLHTERKRSFFSPRQRRLQDIPFLPIHIMGGFLYYLAILEILSGRASSIAPFFIGLPNRRKVPVTPLANPGSALSSHHRLRLYEPNLPNTAVELLIRDEDLYFVAFRSCRGDIEHEENWSIWFRFQNAVIPSFLPSVTFDMEFDYGQSKDCRPGGNQISMTNMYMALASFDADRDVTSQFKRAIFSVIALFCEARRLRSMRTLMSNRIANRTPPEELEEPYWRKINGWTSMGGVAVQALKYHRLIEASVLPQNLRTKHDDLHTIDDLVGDEGELLVVKFRKEDLKPEWEEKQLKRLWSQRRSEDVANPDFVIPQPPPNAVGPHPGH